MVHREGVDVAKHKLVAVRRRVGDARGSGHPAGTADVFDHDLLAQHLGQARGEDAPDRIGGAACGERHDQRDWPGRPILGWKSLRHHRRRRQRDRQRGHREASSQEA